jgi:hypothetical protein
MNFSLGMDKKRPRSKLGAEKPSSHRDSIAERCRPKGNERYDALTVREVCKRTVKAW